MTRREVIAGVATATIASTGLANANSDERPDFWRSWAITEGDDIRLCVEGIYNLGGPGVVAYLKEVPELAKPSVLILELVVATLPGMWAQVIQPIPVQYIKKDFKAGAILEVIVKYPKTKSTRSLRIADAKTGPRVR